ncbi:MAG: hypothetical protein AB1391_04125 [Candidatus Micrarchaeota archaeon]
MEFNEMLISTGVDALIKLIREKGKIEITVASQLLNISISSIEDWAHTLENEGIISIEYQLTKVYLKWVSPTEEEISHEKTELESKKSELLQELKERDEKALVQLNEITALKSEFGINYSAIMSRINEIEKKNADATQTKDLSEENYYKVSDKIKELEGKTVEVGNLVKSMHEQLEKTRNELLGSDIRDQMNKIMETGKEITSLKEELEAMEKKVQDTLDSISKADVDISEIKKPIESIYNDYDLFKQEMNKEKESLRETESISKLLSNAKEEIKILENSIKESTREIKNLNSAVEEIEKNVVKMAVRVKKDEEKATHFLEALKGTEETLNQFKINDGKSHSEEIDKLIERSDALDEKMNKFRNSVDEALPFFENTEKLITSLSELRKKISEERKKLADESGAIFTLLDEEAATYSTFQKIKERAANTINEYLSQLERIEVDYEKIEKEINVVEKTFDASLVKFKEGIDYKSIEKLSTSVDKLVEKKKLLDEVNAKIEALDLSATKIAKQIKLLGKEAELLEMRAGSFVPSEKELEQYAKTTEKKKKEIKESIKLTEDEQKEFDIKRDELRKLIKKLWEEE